MTFDDAALRRVKLVIDERRHLLVGEMNEIEARRSLEIKTERRQNVPRRVRFRRAAATRGAGGEMIVGAEQFGRRQQTPAVAF